jgi:hypothetical protein
MNEEYIGVEVMKQYGFKAYINNRGGLTITQENDLKPNEDTIVLSGGEAIILRDLIEEFLNDGSFDDSPLKIFHEEEGK